MENARQLKFPFFWDMLSNLDLSTLPSVEIRYNRKRQYIGCKALPDQPATYIFHTEADGVVYVGATVSLTKRWHGHLSDWRIMGILKKRKNLTVSWLSVDPRTDPDVEVFLISHYKPQANGGLYRYHSGKSQTPKLRFRPKRTPKKSEKLGAIHADLKARRLSQAQIARNHNVSRQYINYIYHKTRSTKRKVA